MANPPPGGDVQMTPAIFLGGVAVGERGVKKELNSSDASEITISSMVPKI